jgi:hypothetical protein
MQVRAVGRDVSPLPMRPAARPNLNCGGAASIELDKSESVFDFRNTSFGRF